MNKTELMERMKKAAEIQAEKKRSVESHTKLKPQVADILINECGLPELVSVEFGGTLANTAE